MFNIFGTVSNSCGIEITVGKLFSPKMVSRTNKAYHNRHAHTAITPYGHKTFPSRKEDNDSSQAQLLGTDL